MLVFTLNLLHHSCLYYRFMQEKRLQSVRQKPAVNLLVISFINTTILIIFGWTFCLITVCKYIAWNKQKQPSIGVLVKRCSKNMQQIYRRTPMPKCDFNKVVRGMSVLYSRNSPFFFYRQIHVWSFSMRLLI